MPGTPLPAAPSRPRDRPPASELDLAVRVIAPVVPHQDALAVDAGDDAHGPPPHRLQIRQRVLGVIDAEVDAVVPVREQELSPVLEVAVDHLDDRLPEVGELLQQLALHLLELAVEDLPAVRLLVEAVDEQLLLHREVGGEELVDEGHVVVVLAHLEDLLPAQAQLLVPSAAGAQVVALVVLLAEPALVPALLDVAPELDAQLVRVDGARARSHGSGVVVGVVDDLAVLECASGHDGGVPVRVVVDEAAGGVAVRLLDGDVVDVGAAVGDLDDLVLPLFCLEPLPLVDVVGQGLLLAGETEADLLEEFRRRDAEDLHMPAPILLRAPPAENTEVQEQELDLLAHGFAGRAEDHALLSGVAVAIEVGAQEGSHDFLWRSQDGFWNLLLASTRTVRKTQRLDQKVRRIFRVDQDAVPAVIPFHDAPQSEQLMNERCEVFDAFDVRGGES